MRNNNLLILLICALLSCEKIDNTGSEPIEEVKSLNSLVNEDFVENSFYNVYYDQVTSDFEKSLVLILPSSSCFNCFEDLNIKINSFFELNPDWGLLVIKNSKIKDREIYFSLQNVLEKGKIQIIEIHEVNFTDQHMFYPKLGFYSETKICCIEVFEQANNTRIQRYFEFLDLIN